MNYLLLLIPIGLTVLFLRATNSLLKQSKNDWKTLEDLQKKANKLNNKSSKGELMAFHKEFAEKASKIHNKFITPKLYQIDGYLRGLYKNNKQ